MAPNKLSSVPLTLVNKNDSAGKRKNSPNKGKDSNEAGPTLSSKPSGPTSMKRWKTIVSNTKGFYYVNSDLTSSLDLDHWDNVLESYPGTDLGVNSTSQSFIGESSLDLSRRTISGDHPILDYSASTRARMRTHWL